MTIPIIIIVILIIVIAILTVYNLIIRSKIRDFQNLHQRVNNLNVIQDFIDIAGGDLSVDDKIKAINDVMVEKYVVKYSTIVVFNGSDYVIKATNVDQKHWEVLSTLHELDIFKDSIESRNPKYITVNSEQERLPYQKQEFGRAKSAIFFPLYIDNVYIGYWLIESGTPHDFDNIDITIYEKAKENIVAIMKAVDYQKILESIVRTDLFTGLYSAEYLYGDGKKIIDKHSSSAVCMFRITNIEEINTISRELGNKVITKVSEHVKKNIANTYIFVRYMGPKFVIVFCGIDAESVEDFVNELKASTEGLKITLDENNFTTEEIAKPKKGRTKKKLPKDFIVSPTINFVISTYYKGTGIETVLKDLEEYLDEESFNTGELDSI